MCYDVSDVVPTFMPRNSQSIIIHCNFSPGVDFGVVVQFCVFSMPPARKARGRGQRRQSASTTAVPSGRFRKQPGNPAPQVDSLGSGDAMDALVEKLVDKLGPRVESLVDTKLRQHVGQSFSTSPAHSQRSGRVTVSQRSSDSQSQTESADAASSQEAATSRSVTTTSSEPALSLGKFLPTTANQELSAGTATAGHESALHVAAPVVSTALPVSVTTLASFPFRLDARLSVKLKTKIVSGEYVNFGDLLDPSKADQCKLAVKTDEDGATLVVKDPGTAHYKQSVKSIQDWDSAFAIYSTVYCSAHPDQFPQLLKYSETVKRIARQGGDWGHYDVSFRCQRQAMPSLPWDYFHSELYNVAMSHRSKLGQSQALGAGSFRKLFIPNGYCRRYHSTGQCSFGGACKYSHSCVRCQGNHAATKCNTKSRPRKTPGGSGWQSSDDRGNDRSQRSSAKPDTAANPRAAR